MLPVKNFNQDLLPSDFLFNISARVDGCWLHKAGGLSCLSDPFPGGNGERYTDRTGYPAGEKIETQDDKRIVFSKPCII